MSRYVPGSWELCWPVFLPRRKAVSTKQLSHMTIVECSPERTFIMPAFQASSPWFMARSVQ